MRHTSTSWLPHHWQLLQTGPETTKFDENKKVRHVVCIEFREEFISGFDNRHLWVLAIFIIWYSTRTKNFSTKTQLFFLSNPDSESTRKMQFRASFGFLKKRFFELTILIFVFPLTTATRKRVNSRGQPLNAAPQKNNTHLGSTQQVNNHTLKSGEKIAV